MTFEALLDIWQKAALGLLGNERGALHLPPDQWAALDAILREEGGQAEPRAFIEFSLPDWKGEPSLATDWPGGDNYLIEVDVTSELYHALVKVLQGWWKRGNSRPLNSGPLARASGLTQFWRQEAPRGQEGAFERCRDQVVATKGSWRKKTLRLEPRVASRTPRVHGPLLQYDYRIIDDQWAGRVTG
jgi:hypothetical protein